MTLRGGLQQTSASVAPSRRGCRPSELRRKYWSRPFRVHHDRKRRTGERPIQRGATTSHMATGRARRATHALGTAVRTGRGRAWATATQNAVRNPSNIKSKSTPKKRRTRRRRDNTQKACTNLFFDSFGAKKPLQAFNASLYARREAAPSTEGAIVGLSNHVDSQQKNST